MSPVKESEFRVLVVAADEHVGEAVQREISARADDRTPRVRVIAPALTQTAFQHAAGAVDEGLHDAQERLEESLEHAESQADQATVDGRVGDADPMLAIDDALFEFPADEIIVVTHADEEESRWMEDDLFEKARKRFEPPISHFLVRGDEVERVDESGAGADDSEQEEVDPESGNLPPFSKRDLAGMAFALFGTGVLWIIATSSPEETRGGFNFDTLHLLIAGAASLINLAHVVGFLLFESVGYRGVVQRAFARISVYGTAGAIVVSSLLLLNN